jgi:hypothetical protein
MSALPLGYEFSLEGIQGLFNVASMRVDTVVVPMYHIEIRV